ncbi:MAG: heavy metal translocating P-type ATPase [Lentisphaerae bacterium]|nr:heavy metal translocating P-type ATPase [Lentisphaerota bacterium]
MTENTYGIRGLDCAEEVNALRKTVGRLEGVRDLRFDLLNGRMTVRFDEGRVSDAAIRRAVARAGLRTASAREPSAAESRRRTAHLLACGAGGALAAAGLAWHALLHRGLLHALAGSCGAGAQAFPRPSIALYVASVIAGGWFIAPKAWAALRSRRADMNLLMTVAVAGAMAIGEWFEAAAVTFLFALSLVLESWSAERARHAVRALMDLSPATARYICPKCGDLMEKPVADVPPGATVLVRPGERVPLDGVVTAGRTTINEAPITGESVPVAKREGDRVFAGTINDHAAFEFAATRSAHDTTLARIIRMVTEAQVRRARTEQWVETFARYYTPAVMGVALAVAVLPPLVAGGWGRWFYQALVILVIACPCALVISTPVTIVAGLASAARAGVLIKGGAFLEAAARLRCVALDKTGTVTHGAFEVQSVLPFNGHTREEVLARAAALESESGHPVARAIVRAADRGAIAFKAAGGVRDLKGKGAEAAIGGKDYWIGSHRLMHEKGAETPEIHDRALRIEDAAHTLVALGSLEHVCGLIAVADGIRENAAGAVRALRNLGIEHVVMLTGDNRATAEAVSRAAGITEFRAELLPEEKARAVEELTSRYGRVAMIGDGVNDAPAMAASSLAIAMGAAGSDAAIETADIALMTDDLARIPWLVRHARRALAVVRQNIAVALGFKALFMALAAAGLATLWMAIAADMGASLLVIANGLRMLRAPPKP